VNTIPEKEVRMDAKYMFRFSSLLLAGIGFLIASPAAFAGSPTGTTPPAVTSSPDTPADVESESLSTEMKEEMKENPGWIEDVKEDPEAQEHESEPADSMKSSSSVTVPENETAAQEAAEKAEIEKTEQAEHADVEPLIDNEKAEAQGFVENHENEAIHPETNEIASEGSEAGEVENHGPQGGIQTNAPEVEHEGQVSGGGVSVNPHSDH
jgi:hypothetical protein